MGQKIMTGFAIGPAHIIFLDQQIRKNGFDKFSQFSDLDMPVIPGIALPAEPSSA